MRNHRPLILVLVVTGAIFAGSLHAQTDSGRAGWHGLWRFTEKSGADSGRAYLWISPEKGRPPLFLGEEFDPRILTKWSLDGDQLLLSWLQGGSNIVFRGTRAGDRVEGKWERAHPQFRQTDDFSGVRVGSPQQWKPLGEAEKVQTYQGVVEFNSLLAEKASMSSASFKDFWKDSFYPDYLALLRNDPRPEDVHQTITASGFKEASGRLSEALKVVLRSVKRDFPDLNLPKHVVLQPFPPNSPRYKVGETWVIALDTSKIDATPENETLEMDLALAYLRALFYIADEAAERGARRLLTRAAPALMVQTMKFANSPATALHMTEDRYGLLSAALPEIRASLKAGSKLSPEQQDVLATDFLNWLLQDQSLLDILAAKDRPLNDRLTTYLSK